TGPQHRLRSSVHGIFLLGSTAQRLCLLYDSNPADLVWVSRVAANRGGLRINATKSAVTNQNIANWAIRKGRLPSMIIGVGVDMVDLARFERQLERTPKLRERLFTPAERELS